LRCPSLHLKWRRKTYAERPPYHGAICIEFLSPQQYCSFFSFNFELSIFNCESPLPPPITIMKLILASASVRRAEILHAAGFSFTVLSSAIDETPYPGESAHNLVERLAVAKAELVAARAVGPAIVIGADTEVTLEGHLFGKPRSSDDARHMLEKLSGRTHAVVTGVALIRLPDAERLTFVESTLVQFAVLSAEEISRYLATGEPHDKAGGYAIQGRAGRYIPRIEGCYFNVVGLPLARLQHALTSLGWSED
jgi:septum formation protein